VAFIDARFGVAAFVIYADDPSRALRARLCNFFGLWI